MLVIDRIEGGAAVCEGEDRAMREITLDLLPQGAAEGDVLREGPEGLWIDREETARRRRRLARRAERMRKS